MEEGTGRDLRRLLVACAEYHRRHGEWPDQAGLPAAALRGVALELDADAFARVCARLQLRSKRTDGVTVGGRAVVRYQDLRPPYDEAAIAAARRWLGF
jgi:hypothetical protein